MDLIKEVALYVFSLAFLSGLVITVVSGSAKAVKIYLGILTALFLVIAIAGFAFFTQLMVLWLILYMVIITGAAAGYGLYVLMHRQRPGEALAGADLEDYLSVVDFSAREGITEERALSRIRSGYYRGGNLRGHWYIHKSELTS